MSDDEIIEALRSERKRLTAVGLAELLGNLRAGGIAESIIVTYFKRAFPAIPLKVLRDAGGREKVNPGGLSDEEFNELLRPWLEDAD